MAAEAITGDLLEPYREHIQSGMFHGFDFDMTMLRIAAMNLMLHGVENPDIHYQDTLSKQFPEKFAPVADAESRPGAGLDIVLANPPFKGSLAEDDVHPSLLRQCQDQEDRTALRRADTAHAKDWRTIGHDRAGRRTVRLVERASGPARASCSMKTSSKR